MWTSDKILDLGLSQAKTVFSGDNGNKLFKSLLRQWHPDVCQDEKARLVFEHLMSLRSSLKGEKGSGSFVDMILNGRKKRLNVLSQNVWYAGRRWVSRSYFVWEFDDEDVYQNYFDNIKRLPFKDANMRKQFENIFPLDAVFAKSLSGKNIVLIKRKNCILLTDWLKTQGPIPEKHVAWIGSGLLNILCWSEWAKWSLTGVSIESVAFDPKTHEVSMPLGWEVAVPDGEEALFVPQRVYDVFPGLSSTLKVPESVGGEMVRQTLKEALGDPSGMRLSKLNVPENMKLWLLSPSAKTPLEDYKSWFEALHKDFGERKFVKWNIAPLDAYPEQQ